MPTVVRNCIGNGSPSCNDSGSRLSSKEQAPNSRNSSGMMYFSLSIVILVYSLLLLRYFFPASVYRLIVNPGLDPYLKGVVSLIWHILEPCLYHDVRTPYQ